MIRSKPDINGKPWYIDLNRPLSDSGRNSVFQRRLRQVKFCDSDYPRLTGQKVRQGLGCSHGELVQNPSYILDTLSALNRHH